MSCGGSLEGETDVALDTISHRPRGAVDLLLGTEGTGESGVHSVHGPSYIDVLGCGRGSRS